MFKNRKLVEEKICKVYDILDPTGQNSQLYKTKFARMNDKEFIEFFKQDFPLKFCTKLFEVEPKLSQIKQALQYMGVPLFEKVNRPDLYVSKDGKPVQSKPCLILYVSIKRTKQFLSKKNSMSTEITTRNMKTGRLLSKDKNGNTSDKEIESLAVFGFEKALKELATYRADAMNAKSEFYNEITSKGMVSQSEVRVSKDDSLARNQVNAYLLGSLINTNLINDGNYLHSTLIGKQRKTTRE